MNYMKLRKHLTTAILRVILPLMILLIGACEKLNPPATCVVINNVEPFESDIPSYDGTLYSATLNFFSDKEGDSQIGLGALAPGGDTSGIIEIPRNVDRMKVSFRLLGGTLSNHPYNLNYYVLAFTFVEQGQYYELVIDDHTFFSTKVNYGCQEAWISFDEVFDPVPGFAESTDP